MPEDEKVRTINDLHAQLASLMEQKDSMNALAEKLMEKRNKFNDKVKVLKDEIAAARTERDNINSSVKELKERRNSLTEETHRKVGEIQALVDADKVLAEKKPPRSYQSLQEEVESIDWHIQTSSLTLQEDKELVEKIKQLETQLSVHRKHEKLRGKIRKLRTDIEELRNQSNDCHQKLTAQATESQKTHAGMLAKLEELKTAKREADEAHKQLQDAKEKEKPLQEKIKEIRETLRNLHAQVKDDEQEKKRQNEEVLRQTIEARAKEKLKRGEKLTWAEFTLLAEKGEMAQD